MYAIRDKIRKIAEWLIQQPVIKERLWGMRIFEVRGKIQLLWIMFTRTGEVFMFFPYTLCIWKFTCATTAYLFPGSCTWSNKRFVMRKYNARKVKQKANRIPIKYVHIEEGIKYVHFYDFLYYFISGCAPPILQERWNLSNIWINFISLRWLDWTRKQNNIKVHNTYPYSVYATQYDGEFMR